MQKTGFINELAITAGYPVWEKSTLKLIKVSTSTTTSNSLLQDYEGADTCILIPMVLEDGVYVNAFISAVIINDSVTMRLYYKNDYKAYPFRATQPTTSVTTAEEFATQMMLFDEAVFGYTAFQLKDKRLFHTGTNYSDTAGVKVEIAINSNPPTGGGNNLIYCSETEIFISYCTTPLASQCIPRCDGCGAPTCWTITLTQETCTSTPEMPGGGGWRSAPPGGPGGGGGGGGGNPPGECQVGGLIENGFAPPNPCYPGGGNPLPPVPPIPPLPNRHLIDSLQGFPCAQNILARLPNMNNETRTIINDVFNVNEDVNLLFKPDLSLTRDSMDGYSVRSTSANPVNFNETIFLNPWIMSNSTQEYILATMFHETLHASIDYWRMMYITQEIDPHQFKTMFPFIGWLSFLLLIFFRHDIGRNQLLSYFRLLLYCG